jgi:TRAP-type C4-dicarboxylate transport system permease small subunit
MEFSGDKLFVSEAKLRFSVQLSGFRWFIKNWFFTSATIGIAQIFMFLMVVVLVLYYFIFIAQASSDEPTQNVRTFPEARERSSFEREKKE